MRIVVVGAGIVGASAAIWLRRAGHDVTLVEREGPAAGASFGNAALLASCAIVPVTVPGLALKGPKYLFDPNFPLFLRWSYLPKLVPWMVRYLAHANLHDTRRIARALTDIIGDSLEQHQALTRGTRAEKWVQPCEYSFAYRNRAAFEEDALSWELRREAGFVPELIEGPAVREKEPILGPAINLLAVNKNHGFILNPGDYVADLVRLLEELGGRHLRAEVTDFDLSGGRITSVLTDQGPIPCDRAVLATGAWSKPLMRKLGLNVPLETERGYHIVFHQPNIRPNAPMMMTTGKFVATPTDEGLRCAGVVEFGGMGPDKSPAPLALMRRKIKEAFPTLTAASETEWVGFRPATTDSLPLVGEVGNTGVFAAFGHQHVGLTGGPKTGRLVADLISGNHPNTDMRPFEPKRFAKRQ